ncbi:U1-type zinc finger-containing protein [Cavenderia fasciculata]|uniref:U1-type zinc finger-containing protein n=1 Tax=Cavenderia fasciculata TaxID=261658 RepID=F4PXD2_CACFS|nr:U1-type zinc finger-containing protein [Cavenderia fasciculata]EGG19442.1 U1-type zinc finger-containing protein [Cavenderia fasciculata]|eukprot:XP_004357736.1 U1-type zinc finger-containing protein [Cavenderia fasciculata]
MSEYGKAGSGGMQSSQYDNIDRRERLKKLAMETIDISKDPYVISNHLGSYECRLCLTQHNNIGNYLAHTQGKKHQTNLARRAARDQKDNPNNHFNKSSSAMSHRPRIIPKKTIKIGRPGYKIIKQRDPDTGQLSLLFQIDYPEIEQGLQPRHRFMSSFEQHVDHVNKDYQYILFAAEPYETIAFKIPNKDIDRTTGPDGKFFTHWDKNKLSFTLQLYFKESSNKDQQQQTQQQQPPPTPTTRINRNDMYRCRLVWNSNNKLIIPFIIFQEKQKEKT